MIPDEGSPASSTGVLGAEPGNLREVAGELRVAADQLDSGAGGLTTTLVGVSWVGEYAANFEYRWTSAYQPGIVALAGTLRELATALDDNAADQDATSGAGSSVCPVVALPVPAGGDERDFGGAGDDPPTGDDEWWLELLNQLHVLIEDGLSDVRAADKMREVLLDAGFPAGLLEQILTDEFMEGLTELGKYVDVAGVLLDMLNDFMDHPGLPLDERLLHSGIDALTRFAVASGGEVAATFVTGLFSPSGPLAIAAGWASGQLVDLAAGLVYDFVDEKYDVTDVVADEVVDFYRFLKDNIQILEDAKDVVVDAATGTVRVVGAGGKVIAENAADAGGWIYDNSGLDTVVDVGGDVIGDIIDGVTGDDDGNGGSW